jgi:hypothetical protein
MNTKIKTYSWKRFGEDLAWTFEKVMQLLVITLFIMAMFAINEGDYPRATLETVLAGIWYLSILIKNKK